MKERIFEKLTKNLHPKKLEVINQSHLHQGHLGDDGSGETHFEVQILADDFKGESKVSSHRKINKILAEEFEQNGLHALSIKVI
jgi:BolA protein